MSATPLRLFGAPGSPYSRKMRALLRYRRIPFRWAMRDSKEAADIPPVPVRLIPILVLPGKGGAPDESMIDSTFQLRRLEELEGARRVVPPDPVIAFVDALLEDYGDEWLTKAMFHYRWAYQADIDKAASVLPRWSRVDVPEDSVQRFSKVIAERQIGRLHVVGSNETTGPVIEASYRRLLERLDAHLTRHPHVMGGRPGASDFGIFGQLTQLVLFDPTPAAVALAISPRIYAWCEILEDLSGLEVGDDDWITRDDFPDTLRALLAEVGRVYVPFLLANAAALEQGAENVACEIDGRAWVQKPFPYQGKCLRWLREQHAALGSADQGVLAGLLDGTGCEALF